MNFLKERSVSLNVSLPLRKKAHNTTIENDVILSIMIFSGLLPKMYINNVNISISNNVSKIPIDRNIRNLLLRISILTRNYLFLFFLRYSFIINKIRNCFWFWTFLFRYSFLKIYIISQTAFPTIFVNNTKF